MDFSFWNRKKRYQPVLTAANPGQGADIKATFANDERTWIEKTNVLDCLHDVAKERGIQAAITDGWLRFANGLHLCPSINAFLDHLKSDEFFGIRLFAARYEDGAAEADCRVNGEDWPAGKEALIRYVNQWPQRGFEFRKQYVAIESTTKSSPVGE